MYHRTKDFPSFSSHVRENVGYMGSTPSSYMCVLRTVGRFFLYFFLFHY